MAARVSRVLRRAARLGPLGRLPFWPPLPNERPFILASLAPQPQPCQAAARTERPGSAAGVPSLLALSQLAHLAQETQHQETQPQAFTGPQPGRLPRGLRAAHQ